MAKKKKKKDKREYRYTTGGRVDMRTGGRVKAQVGGRQTTEARGVSLIDEEAVQRGPGDLPTATQGTQPITRTVVQSPVNQPISTPTDPVMRGGPAGPGVPFNPNKKPDRDSVVFTNGDTQQNGNTGSAGDRGAPKVGDTIVRNGVTLVWNGVAYVPTGNNTAGGTGTVTGTPEQLEAERGSRVIRTDKHNKQKLLL